MAARVTAVGARSRAERPLIGLTTSEVRTAQTLRPVPHGEPTPHEVALGVTYVRAVEAAGGVPIIIPPAGELHADTLLACMDGLLLPGGPDIDPSTYGAEEHPRLGPFDPDVDRFELELVRHADERELPMLAICRGAQALNVARGGTLIQHLPDLGRGLNHRQTEPGTQTTHTVDVEGDSRLAEVVGAGTLDVNTFHHQGIERLGRDLRAVAFAPDGTVEALEAEDRDFCLGVQWHAETLIDREPQIALFCALVEAAAESGRAAGRRAA
jgi:putative glutamine amidotransferase